MKKYDNANPRGIDVGASRPIVSAIRFSLDRIRVEPVEKVGINVKNIYGREMKKRGTIRN